MSNSQTGELGTIASSARVWGSAKLGIGSTIAQGTVVRSHGSSVQIGQRTVFGHRSQIIGAHIGDLCEIGNGSILMPGSVLEDGCILGEGTLIGRGEHLRANSVVLGRPGRILRAATTGADTIVGSGVRIIGPGAMIHGCHIGRSTVVEPGAIVCDWSAVGAESVVAAGACIKQRDTFGERSIIDGFPAEVVGHCPTPRARPGWAFDGDVLSDIVAISGEARN